MKKLGLNLLMLLSVFFWMSNITMAADNFVQLEESSVVSAVHVDHVNCVDCDPGCPGCGDGCGDGECDPGCPDCSLGGELF